ncbi:hypothetical protein EYF80_004965 [Liparis tanakae]|uniref:Uncharacterized protein n=1 Tax=Liparis tanakae TaxID=230148 RepID=A0A4Z2J402_9TELE|nr:hypothetical protein EYF80_004965 [Liparis tanakae]
MKYLLRFQSFPSVNGGGSWICLPDIFKSPSKSPLKTCSSEKDSNVAEPASLPQTNPNEKKMYSYSRSSAEVSHVSVVTHARVQFGQ